MSRPNARVRGSEAEQVKFATEAVSTIDDLVAPYNRDHPGTRVILGNWYELIDGYGYPCVELECWFGLLRADWSRKVGYAVVQAKIADFGRWTSYQSFGINPWENQGGDIILAKLNSNAILDGIFMAIDNPIFRNQFYYTIGWDLSSAGTFASWAPILGLFGPFDAGGDESQGGGVAVADIDRNGVMDALFMNVDNPGGENNYRYRIAFNIVTSGSQKGQFASWSGILGYVGAGADETQGGGVAFGDIDRNGIQDAVFMVVNNPGGGNDFRYRVAWNIGTDGTFSAWSGVKGYVGAPGEESQGGGARIVDWDGDGSLDLIFVFLDNPPGENSYRFMMGSGLSTAGDVTGGWSQVWGYEKVPGQENQGGGVAVGDIDRDGRLDLMFAAVDNPIGANNIRFRTRFGI